jgi:large subunit ribosomal protein L14|tara:strand:+ start:464 stop:844 length:381 start_codon:yes stop_codon:yes gene_type:complete
MIQTQSILIITDNSGAKTVKCIKVLGGFQRRYSYVGNTIVIAVQKLKKKNKYRSKVKKGEVLRAVITRTKSKKKRDDGLTFQFDINSGVLINKQNKPVGTRIFGPVIKEMKNKKFMKLASLSSGFV